MTALSLAKFCVTPGIPSAFSHIDKKAESREKRKIDFERFRKQGAEGKKEEKKEKRKKKKNRGYTSWSSAAIDIEYDVL